jgi:mannose-1-phosphate guanylyltransferase
VVPTKPDGEVVAFVEKPPRGQAPTDWINAGTYVLEASVLADIPARLRVSIERETFPRMLERPGHLFAMRAEGYWLDIGAPQKYFEAQLDVLAGRTGLPPAPGAVEQAPGVWVQPGASVASDAALVAPVLIGERARVGSGARIEASVLGADTTVGEGAVVLRSVLLAGADVGEGTKVADEARTDEVTLDCAS